MVFDAHYPTVLAAKAWTAWVLGGHAEKAKQLLMEADLELRQAANDAK
jgi:hypothetical protein